MSHPHWVTFEDTESGYCGCLHCCDRHEAARERDERGGADPEVDGLTMAIVAAMEAPKKTRVERAEALAMLIMERIRAEREHHEAEHHGWKD